MSNCYFLNMIFECGNGCGSLGYPSRKKGRNYYQFLFTAEMYMSAKYDKEQVIFEGQKHDYDS